jgi:hypothetical protein
MACVAGAIIALLGMISNPDMPGFTEVLALIGVALVLASCVSLLQLPFVWAHARKGWLRFVLTDGLLTVAIKEPFVKEMISRFPINVLGARLGDLKEVTYPLSARLGGKGKVILIQLPSGMCGKWASQCLVPCGLSPQLYEIWRGFFALTGKL